MASHSSLVSSFLGEVVAWVDKQSSLIYPNGVGFNSGTFVFQIMEGLDTQCGVCLSVWVLTEAVVFSKFLTRFLISWARVISSDWISSVVDPLSPHSDIDRLLIPLSRDRRGDLLLNERLSSDLGKIYPIVDEVPWYFEGISYRVVNNRCLSSSSSTSSSSLMDGSVRVGWPPIPFIEITSSWSASYLPHEDWLIV